MPRKSRPAEYHASSDSDLAEDADEVVDPDRRAGPVLGQRGEIRLVLDMDGKAKATFELAADGNAVPAEVRREDDRPDASSTSPGTATEIPIGRSSSRAAAASASPRSRAEPVEHWPGGGATVVAVCAVLVADGSREILEGDGDVVDVDLEADADEDVRELERLAGPADAARSGRLARLTDEFELDELVDEARDGAAREPCRGGDLRPRARARRGDPAQDDAEFACRTVVWSARARARPALEGKGCPGMRGRRSRSASSGARMILSAICMEGGQTNAVTVPLSTTG